MLVDTNSPKLARADINDMFADLGYGTSGSVSPITTTGEANKLVKVNSSGNVLLGSKALPLPASIRDAFQISRYINGLTDCHSFSDKTEITNATDCGAYGTFDALTKVSGSHAQNHLFAFQDRTSFDGSGTITNWGNIIHPTKNGTGTVTNRYDIWIKDITGTGGSVGAHIGFYVENLSRSADNLAFNVQQDNGYTFYAPNAGKWYLGGLTTLKTLQGTGSRMVVADSTGKLSADSLAYAENSYIPTLSSTGQTGSWGYFAQYGKYVRIGNKLTIFLVIGWSAKPSTGTNIKISLPAQVDGYTLRGSLSEYSGITFAGKQLVLSNYQEDSGNIYIFQTVSGESPAARINVSDVASSGLIKCVIETLVI
jgi:hypothetical protein